MKTNSFISHSDLVSLIMEREKSGATVIGLTTETEPKLLKKSRTTGEPCPYASVKKISIGVTGMIGVIYQNSVNNQREREGGERTFEVSEHKWATHYNGSRAILANKKTPDKAEYIEFQASPNARPQVVYVADGRPVGKSELVGYLPKESDNSGHQGVSREVVIRSFKLSSVTEIAIGGERFRVIPDPATVTV